jgi:putative nucleotidyltransferase with HDIG domain
VISTQTILDRIRHLPTLSSSMERLAALIRDERSSASDFERVIRPDPALTANLLRIANSVWFGLRSRADTVRQAITLLGIKRVYEAAASAALSRVIPRRLAGYEIDASAFWQHSIAVAILAERLAKEIGTRPPDLTFTAALLHDVGKLVIGVFVSQESTAILDQVRTEGLPFVSAERSILGVDHAEVGSEVALAWRLPDAAVWSCRWHHQPDSAPPEVDRALVDLVHTSDGLAHSLGLGADAGELARRISPEVTARLGLRTARLERVAGESLEAIREMANILNGGGTP